LEFDHLSPDEVIWEPYENQRVDERVGSYALSSLCIRDAALWLTTKKLVVDITIEDYAPHRVMRQFGRRQQIPPPQIDVIPSSWHL